MVEKIVYQVEADTSKAERSFKSMANASNKVDDGIENAGKKVRGLGSIADGVKNKFNSLGSVVKQGFGLGLGIKLFDTFSQKLMENEKVARLFEAAMNVLTGVIGGIVEVIEPAINWMMKLFKDPKQWWEDLVTSLQKGAQWIKTNLIDLVLNKFVEWANDAQIAVLKLRKAWNEFTGDTEEAKKIQDSIDELTKQNIELAKANAQKIENVKELVTDVVDWVEKSADKIKKNVKKVMDNQDFLLDYEKNLARLQRKLQEISIQAEIDAEKQRQIRDSEFESISDRIKANEKLAKVLKQGMEDELNTQNAIIGNMEKRASIEKNNKALIQQIADERLKLKEIENKYAGQMSEQLTNINSLLRERIGIQKTLSDAEVEAYAISEQAAIDGLKVESERINAQIKLEDELFNKKMANLDSALAKEKEGTSAYAEILAQQLILEEEHNAKVKENNRALTKALTDEQQSRLDTIKSAFNGIAALSKENSKVAVAMQIGNAIIDTYSGATKALAQGGIYGFIGAAAVIASGLANVRKIIEQSKKMGVDTGGDVSTGGGGSTSMAQSGPSIGVVGGQINSGNQLATAIGGAMNKPQRSYVIGSDVSTQQGLDRKISQNATLGW